MTKELDVEVTEADCPGVPKDTLDTINALTNSELEYHIDLGSDSKFGPGKLPIVKLALKKRIDAELKRRREEDIKIASESNEIAASALEQAKLANKKADQARLWSAIAVFISLIISALGIFINGK